MDETTQSLQEIARATLGPLFDISQEEKLMLVKVLQAQGVRTGAWYKCPNGESLTGCSSTRHVGKHAGP